MAVDPNMSYEDFCSELSQYIKDNFKDIKGKISGYPYQGFSHKDVFKTLLIKMANARISEKDVRVDVDDMIAIFLARGPNLTKVKINTIKGGENSYNKRVETLIKRYDIKSVKPKPSDITLPRICMIFASRSRNIYLLCKDQILNYPVTESEIGLSGSQEFFYNFVPCLLKPASLGQKYKVGMVFAIHNIYQSILTKKTALRNARNSPKYFPNATKYTMLACTNTFVTGEAQKIAETDYTTQIDEVITVANIIMAIKSFFSELPDEVSEEVTTVHYIVNYCILKRKAITEIKDEYFMKSLTTIRTELV